LRKTPQKFLIAATRAAFFTQICTKSFVGWGFAPDPTGGAYSAFPDPIAVFNWPLLTERRGEIGQRMGRKEGEGERRGKGRRGKGRGGKGRAPMALWHGAPQCLNPALAPIQPTSIHWIIRFGEMLES